MMKELNENNSCSIFNRALHCTGLAWTATSTLWNYSYQRVPKSMPKMYVLIQHEARMVYANTIIAVYRPYALNVCSFNCSSNINGKSPPHYVIFLLKTECPYLFPMKSVFTSLICPAGSLRKLHHFTGQCLKVMLTSWTCCWITEQILMLKTLCVLFHSFCSFLPNPESLHRQNVRQSTLCVPLCH